MTSCLQIMVGTGDAKRRMLARVKSDTTYLTWMTFGHARTTSAPMPAADIYHFGPASERPAEWSRRTGMRRRPSLCRGRVWSLLRLVAVVSGLWSLSRLVAVASRRGRVLSRSRLVGSDKSDRPTDGAAAKERRALRRKGSFTARELKCESKHTISGGAVHRAQTETERSTGLRGSRTPQRTAAVLGQLTGY